MARFYLHVFNHFGNAADDDGSDLPDTISARRVAIEGIRSMVAEEARQGIIDLTGRIEIEDSGGNPILTVGFDEAFELSQPDEGRRGD